MICLTDLLSYLSEGELLPLLSFWKKKHIKQAVPQSSNKEASKEVTLWGLLP